MPHYRRNNRVLSQTTLSLQIEGADGKNMIAIHQLTPFVHTQDPVCVPIVSKSEVRLVGNYGPSQPLRMQRTALFIDVGAVGLDIQRYDLGIQFLEDRRRDLVARAIGKVDIASDGIAHTIGLTDLTRGRPDSVNLSIADQFLDSQFHRIRELQAVAWEELDPIILIRVVGGRNDHAGVGSKASADTCDPRRRNRANQ